MRLNFGKLTRLTAIAVIIGGMTFLNAAYGQKLVALERLPEPKENNQLFYLQRDPNENTVIYQLNYINGQLSTKEPVKAFWIRYAENGKQKDLSTIERKFAYGVTAKNLPNNEYELRLAADKNMPFYLLKSDKDNQYHVFVKVNQQLVMLKRVFVRVKGGSFWFPKVDYVELRGVDKNTNKELIHKINM